MNVPSKSSPFLPLANSTPSPNQYVSIQKQLSNGGVKGLPNANLNKETAILDTHTNEGDLWNYGSFSPSTDLYGRQQPHSVFSSPSHRTKSSGDATALASPYRQTEHRKPIGSLTPAAPVYTFSGSTRTINSAQHSPAAARNDVSRRNASATSLGPFYNSSPTVERRVDDIEYIPLTGCTSSGGAFHSPVGNHAMPPPPRNNGFALSRVSATRETDICDSGDNRIGSRKSLGDQNNTPSIAQAEIASGEAQSAAAVIVNPEPSRTSIAPNQVFYTRDCIHPFFRNGKCIVETFQEILMGETKVADIEPIKIVRWRDKTWALTGNRRIYLYKKLEAFGLLRTISVTHVPLVESVFFMKMSTRNNGTAVFVHGEPYMDQKLDQLVVEAMQGPWERITQGTGTTQTTATSNASPFNNNRSLRLALRGAESVKSSPATVTKQLQVANCVDRSEESKAIESTPFMTGDRRLIVNTPAGTAPNRSRFSCIPTDENAMAVRWKWARRMCAVIIGLLCIAFAASLIHVAALIFQPPSS